MLFIWNEDEIANMSSFYKVNRKYLDKYLVSVEEVKVKIF